MDIKLLEANVAKCVPSKLIFLQRAYIVYCADFNFPSAAPISTTKSSSFFFLNNIYTNAEVLKYPQGIHV